MTVTPAHLRRISMFDQLLEPELVEIMGCFTEVRIEPGELLFAEGQAANSACFLLEGELEAVKALPGGGEAQVGVILPGTMIGEMALMAGGTRTATVRARCGSSALSVSYYFFHAALTQMSVPAFKILRAIIRKMVGRLDEIHDRILKQWDCETYSPFAAGGSAEEPPKGPVSFEYRPFVSVLPCFESFSESEVDDILGRGELMEMPRGTAFYQEGLEPNACCLVLRGAIDQSVMRDRRYQLSVLGPGRLCGSSALIAKRPHNSDAHVRSGALLLCFSPAEFNDLIVSDVTSCLKFQNLIGSDLLMQLKSANNLLAQLVSQSYILSEPRSRSL